MNTITLATNHTIKGTKLGLQELQRFMNEHLTHAPAVTVVLSRERYLELKRDIEQYHEFDGTFHEATIICRRWMPADQVRISTEGLMVDPIKYYEEDPEEVAA